MASRHRLPPPLAPERRHVHRHLHLRQKQYDEDFHLLDGRIAEAARALPGYLGEESWEDPARGLISNVYYWESLDALQALIRHPLHQQAKAAQSRWLDGYRVVIAQVIRQYGDDRLHSPPTRNRPRCPPGPDARPVRGRPCAALPSENVRLPSPAALLAARPAADPASAGARPPRRLP